MTTNNRIHWLGAGLSSLPGIKLLAQGTTPLIVWNRSLDKARQHLRDVAGQITINPLDWQQLQDTVTPGDVVVSMLPATLHIQVAQLCLAANAHFVSSSYISPEMAALNQQAKDQNLSFVNEVGLDPGIDHLLAHRLMHDYQQSAQFDKKHQHYFRSYCGGFPKVANDFKYKFSWSPLGVLKALRSPAQWLEQGRAQTSSAPWDALSEYQAQFAHGSEMFQAYPNRDSLPFMAQYGFGPDWNVQQFVRGTLRLGGWSTAWQPIFDQVSQLSAQGGEAAEQQLQQLSQQLEQKYSYAEGEADRVVLCVELQVKEGEQTIWHQSYQLDSYGHATGHAMGRLVSLTVSIAVAAVLNGEIQAGVSGAPDQVAQVDNWLNKLAALGEPVSLHDWSL